MTEDELRAHLGRALRLVAIQLPHLAGMVAEASVSVSRRVATAAVFASGRLVVNPEWFALLGASDAAFVLAHELLHLVLRSHERRGEYDHRLLNVAHDCIINDMLSAELGMPVPAGGLVRWDARHEPLEGLMRELATLPTCAAGWRSAVSATEGGVGALGQALVGAGLASPPPPSSAAEDDVLDGALEDAWFPGDATTRAERERRLISRAARSASLGILRAAVAAGGRGSPGDALLVDALRRAYDTPWEEALQVWLEHVAPGPRTYARASRRGAERTDTVLAGRRREGWTVHVVVDTSGSMFWALPQVLGALAAFAEASGVTEVHVLECDARLQEDRWLPVDSLLHITVHGLGGSDLTEAMGRLARDDQVTAAVVITDGVIGFPHEPPPYNVLWAVIRNPAFAPGYGHVVELSLPG